MTVPRTEPSVFIVESLNFTDEHEERFEGRILNQMLRLARKDVSYVYIRTRKELGAVLSRFEECRMRYLHVSCHGNSDTIALTLDELSFEDFAGTVRPFLNDRRLFVSACEVVNDELATALLPGSGCHSVIGPKKAISFRDAAVMWAAFYHLMFRANPDAMKQDVIKEVLEKICNTFEEPFLYYRSSRSNPKGFKKYAYG